MAELPEIIVPLGADEWEVLDSYKKVCLSVKGKNPRGEKIYNVQSDSKDSPAPIQFYLQEDKYQDSFALRSFFTGDILAVACGLKSPTVSVFKASPKTTPVLVGRIDFKEHYLIHIRDEQAALVYHADIAPSLLLYCFKNRPHHYQVKSNHDPRSSVKLCFSENMISFSKKDLSTNAFLYMLAVCLVINQADHDPIIPESKVIQLKAEEMGKKPSQSTKIRTIN